MQLRSTRRWTLAATIGVSLIATSMIQLAAWADSRTAPAPKFDSATVNDIFFPDARKHLGPGGPPVPGQQMIVGPSGGGGSAPSAPGAPGGATHNDGNAWSAIVSAETIEGEVKAQPAAIDEAMKSTNQQKNARMVMTYLAALYGVVYRYDKDIRWKDDSQALRDNFARAGNNLKAWTDSQKKQVAKLKTDLTDLIQGNKPQLTAGLDGEAPWLEIADRPPLMHRLEIGQQERLNKWTSDAGTVTKNKDAILREAEVMAMLGHIIQDKSYEFADDETYMGFARNLEKFAHECAEAVKRGDAAAASSAVSNMQKSCDDCHGGFR